MKKIAYRALRKSAHLATPVLSRLATISQKVEHKTTRIITGQTSDGVKVVEGDAHTIAPFIDLQRSYLPEATPLYPALPKPGRKPALTILVPTLNKGLFFGGIATALITAAMVAKKQKLDLRVLQTFTAGDADVGQFLKDKNIAFEGDISVEDVSAKKTKQYIFIDIHPQDIFMASAWADAYVLQRLPLKTKFIYLIQDYEPIFFPNSDQRVKAESTYRSDRYIALCNTELLYRHLLSEGFDEVKKNNSVWFEPAVANIQKSIKNNARKRLFIYGRTRVKRNLFFSAIEAVNMAFSKGDLNAEEWDIFMAGQDDIPSLELSSGVKVKNLGKMALDEYYEFMRTIDVAVSPMMAPHPNYPTLEFASTGAAVVSTKYGVKQDLKSYSKNIIMADCSTESMAEAIVRAAALDYDLRLKNAEESTIPYSWLESLEKPVNTLVAHINKH